jgi:hypothetical protein
VHTTHQARTKLSEPRAAATAPWFPAPPPPPPRQRPHRHRVLLVLQHEVHPAPASMSPASPSAAAPPAPPRRGLPPAVPPEQLMVTRGARVAWMAHPPPRDPAALVLPARKRRGRPPAAPACEGPPGDGPAASDSATPGQPVGSHRPQSHGTFCTHTCGRRCVHIIPHIQSRDEYPSRSQAALAALAGGERRGVRHAPVRDAPGGGVAV